MTVMENVCLALTHGRSKLSPNNARKRAREALEQVGMDKLADNSATLVSGGQQQRIALARALAVDPQMLLMDEPLSNLDAQLREEIRQEIRELGRRLHTTIIYVTHDRVEAMALADRVVILDKGRIVQSGGPKETYRRPSTPRIAEFLGSMNWLGGQVTDDPRRSVVQTTMGFLQVLPHTREPADQVLIGMRPEHIHLTDEPHPKQVNSFQTTVTDVTFLGEYSLYLLNCNGRILQVKSLQSIGDRECLWISIPPEAIMIFDRDHERASAQND
jgi:ABC-type sugar transport system ATPase subunit